MSTERNTGGPAFAYGNHEQGGDAGMSLRDWFAGQALAGIAFQIPTTDVGKISSGEKKVHLVGSAAYAIADALLAAREGGAK
jgi:hypothetical protein